MLSYGLELFKKKIKETIFKCEICDYPLNNFMNSRKKKSLCLTCEKNIIKISQNQVQEQYLHKLEKIYNDNPVLSEDIKKTNYYKEVSKYKNFEPKTSISAKKTVTIAGEGTKPLIQLNMKPIDISNLIKDDNEE
jgi:hypothetical protein